VVFGSKRDQKPDALSREDVVGNLYPDSLTSEVDVTPSSSDSTYRRSEGGTGNESVIDPHARFNGKYVSDRDLRIEGEAQGEIECQGTLIISPQARVRSAIKAHNVIINGDYEGDVDCGGRFEIGSTGRVKGGIKTQVLVVKEGAHWEGSVSMTRDAAQPAAPPQGGSGSQGGAPKGGSGQAAAAAAGTSGGGASGSGTSGGGASGGGASGGGAQASIFSKQDREAAAPAGDRPSSGQ
jgi:cytoskeletal protein CcmA (bactofilin family)